MNKQQEVEKPDNCVQVQWAGNEKHKFPSPHDSTPAEAEETSFVSKKNGHSHTTITNFQFLTKVKFILINFNLCQHLAIQSQSKNQQLTINMDRFRKEYHKNRSAIRYYRSKRSKSDYITRIARRFIHQIQIQKDGGMDNTHGIQTQIFKSLPEGNQNEREMMILLGFFFLLLRLISFRSPNGIVPRVNGKTPSFWQIALTRNK